MEIELLKNPDQISGIQENNPSSGKAGKRLFGHSSGTMKWVENDRKGLLRTNG